MASAAEGDDWDRQLARRISAVLRHMKETKRATSPSMLGTHLGVQVQEAQLRDAIGDDVLQAVAAALRASELIRQGLSDDDAASQAAREAQVGLLTLAGPQESGQLKRSASSASILEAVSPSPATAHGRLERLATLMRGEGQIEADCSSPAQPPVPLATSRNQTRSRISSIGQHSATRASLGEIGEVDEHEPASTPGSRRSNATDSSDDARHKKGIAFAFDADATTLNSNDASCASLGVQLQGHSGKGQISPAQTPLGGGGVRHAAAAPSSSSPSPRQPPASGGQQAVLRPKSSSPGSEAASEDYAGATHVDVDVDGLALQGQGGAGAGLGVRRGARGSGGGSAAASADSRGLAGAPPSAGPAAIAALARVVARLADLCGLVAEMGTGQDGQSVDTRGTDTPSPAAVFDGNVSPGQMPAPVPASGNNDPGNRGGATSAEAGPPVGLAPPPIPMGRLLQDSGQGTSRGSSLDARSTFSRPGLGGMIEIVSAQGRRVSVPSLGLPTPTPSVPASHSLGGGESGRTTPRSTRGAITEPKSGGAAPRRLLRLRMQQEQETLGCAGAGAGTGGSKSVMTRQQSASTVLQHSLFGPGKQTRPRGPRRTSDFGVSYRRSDAVRAHPPSRSADIPERKEASTGDQAAASSAASQGDGLQTGQSPQDGRTGMRKSRAPNVAREGGSESAAGNSSSSALSFTGEDVALLAALVNVLAAEYIDSSGGRAYSKTSSFHSAGPLAGTTPYNFAQPLVEAPSEVATPRTRRDSLSEARIHRKRSSLDMEIASMPFAIDSRTRSFLEQQTTSTQQSKGVLYGVRLSGKEKFRAVGKLVGKVMRMGSMLGGGKPPGLENKSGDQGTAGGNDDAAATAAAGGDKDYQKGIAGTKRRLKAAMGRSSSTGRAARGSASSTTSVSDRRRSSATAVRVHAEGIIFHTESMAMPALRDAAMQYELPIAQQEKEVLSPGWNNWLGFDIFEANRVILRMHGLSASDESAAEMMWNRVKETYVPDQSCLHGPGQRSKETIERLESMGHRLASSGHAVASSGWCGEEDDELGMRFMSWSLEELAGGRSKGRSVGHETLVAACYGGLMEVAGAGKFGIKPTTARNLGREIASRYSRANPYHNALHAADVTMGVLFGLCGGKLREHINPRSSLCMVLAAATHDAGHLGVNNPFLTATQHDLALRYNDQSPLENMHCATLFFLMRDCSDADVLGDACHDPSTHAQCRKLITSMVLHTDNAGHFQMVGALEDALDRIEAEVEAGESEGGGPGAGADGEGVSQKLAVEFGSKDESLFMGAILHAFDISNPARDWTLNTRWTDLVTQEFWLQGDQEKERELPIGPMNDRKGPVPKPRSSSGFATALVLPLYRAVARFEGIEMGVPLAQLEANNKRAFGLVEAAGRPDVESKVEDKGVKLKGRDSDGRPAASASAGGGAAAAGDDKVPVAKPASAAASSAPPGM